MNQHANPNDGQLATLGALDPEAPVAAIMHFPTRRAFVEMTMNPEFQAASRHRKAGLANHYMLHLSGAPERAGAADAEAPAWRTW